MAMVSPDWTRGLLEFICVLAYGGGHHCDGSNFGKEENEMEGGFQYGSDQMLREIGEFLSE